MIERIKQIANEVYETLGDGYDESVYEEAMAIEFREQNIKYEVQKTTEIFYKGDRVGTHRLDFIINDNLVVELKAGGSITGGHRKQLRAYLRTLGLDTGMLINFPYPYKDVPQVEIMEESP